MQQLYPPSGHVEPRTLILRGSRLRLVSARMAWQAPGQVCLLMTPGAAVKLLGQHEGFLPSQ